MQSSHNFLLVILNYRYFIRYYKLIIHQALKIVLKANLCFLAVLELIYELTST